MKIFIASDHAGFEMKTKVVDYLSSYNDTSAKNSFELIDLGPNDESRVDYPDFADKVCRSLSTDSTDLGILICGSGQGVCMRANKYSFIRAALCWNEEVAGLSRAHNNANVLCLGARVTDKKDIFKIIDTFLATSFEGGRHQNRIDKLSSKIN